MRCWGLRGPRLYFSLGPELALVTDDLDTYEVIPNEGEECLVIFGFHVMLTVAPQCAHLPPFSV
jgi:hypothetical protein